MLILLTEVDLLKSFEIKRDFVISGEHCPKCKKLLAELEEDIADDYYYYEFGNNSTPESAKIISSYKISDVPVFMHNDKPHKVETLSDIEEILENE